MLATRNQNIESVCTFSYNYACLSPPEAAGLSDMFRPPRLCSIKLLEAILLSHCITVFCFVVTFGNHF